MFRSTSSSASLEVPIQSSSGYVSFRSRRAHAIKETPDKRPLVNPGSSKLRVFPILGPLRQPTTSSNSSITALSGAQLRQNATTLRAVAASAPPRSAARLYGSSTPISTSASIASQLGLWRKSLSPATARRGGGASWQHVWPVRQLHDRPNGAIGFAVWPDGVQARATIPGTKRTVLSPPPRYLARSLQTGARLG